LNNQTKLNEAMNKLAAINRQTGFKASVIEVDAKGAMILDSN
jgi:hypothetical protein